MKSVGFEQEKGKGPTVRQENLEILIKANKLLCAKVRSCYRLSILSNPTVQYFLLKVKTITKLLEKGIAESVKSCNLHQKGRILYFYSLKNVRLR